MPPTIIPMDGFIKIHKNFNEEFGPKKNTNLVPVKQYEINQIAKEINFMLSMKNVTLNEAYEILINGKQKTPRKKNTIPVVTVQQIYISLQREPFCIQNEKDLKNFSRYLIEDNTKGNIAK